MYIETAKTQAKLAELLHEADGCSHIERGVAVEECTKATRYMTQAGVILARLAPTISSEMFPLVRADERDKVAYHIVAELVCCDIHARLEAEAAKGTWSDRDHEYKMPESWYELKKSHDYHPMCHYGGWAASLALEGPKLDKRHEGWSEGLLVSSREKE